MEIIFCKTRADPEFYRSYTDFWRLVELAGFEVVWLDELEPGRDAVYVVTPRNGELPGVLPRLQGDRRCKFVWWCLERPDWAGSVTKSRPVEPEIDELWLSDRWLAGRHDVNGWGPVRFVPLGSHERLGAEPLPVYQFDWTHMSYATPRRQAIYRDIEGTMLRNSWGAIRHEGLRSTRLMVNVHQDNWLVMEPLRFALASAYRIPIVTETDFDSWPYLLREHIAMQVYERLPGLVNTAIRTAQHPPTWKETMGMAERCHARMTQEFEFGKCVKEAVGCLK